MSPPTPPGGRWGALALQPAAREMPQHGTTTGAAPVGPALIVAPPTFSPNRVRPIHVRDMSASSLSSDETAVVIEDRDPGRASGGAGVPVEIHRRRDRPTKRSGSPSVVERVVNRHEHLLRAWTRLGTHGAAGWGTYKPRRE